MRTILVSRPPLRCRRARVAKPVDAAALKAAAARHAGSSPASGTKHRFARAGGAAGACSAHVPRRPFAGQTLISSLTSLRKPPPPHLRRPATPPTRGFRAGVGDGAKSRRRRGLAQQVSAGRHERNPPPQPESRASERMRWRRGPESNRPTRICNPVHNRFATAPREWVHRSGAGEESRTLDLNLGKVALYQLSYSRVGAAGSIAGRPHESVSGRRPGAAPRCLPRPPAAPPPRRLPRRRAPRAAARGRARAPRRSTSPARSRSRS